MYSPFNKELGSVGADDLAALTNVSEGWFVEYKEQLPSPPAIAKSVSAFANHRGGWLMIGVRESKDGSRRAAAFPGVDADAVHGLTDRIRDAVRSHTDPTPHFDIRAIVGPSSDGSLALSKAIIIVRVGIGANPPYIHSSGRIYRRVADCSDPVAETDRAVLDLLVERGRQSQRRLKSFLKSEPILSKGESESSFLRIYFIQDLLGDRDDRVNLSFQEFAELVGSPTSSAVGIVFDNVFTMSEGFVARHVADNDPQHRLLTWEFYANGTSAFTVPLRVGDPTKNPRSRFKYAADFVARLGTLRVERVVDASQFLVSLAALYGMHLSAIQKAGIAGPVFGKTRLMNTWRRIPFFDSEAFLKHVTKYAIPVCQEASAFAPPGTTPGSFLTLDLDEAPNPEERDRFLPLFGGVAPLFASTMEALGVPSEVLLASAKELYSAAERSVPITYRPRQD